MIVCLADDLTGLVELAAQCADRGIRGAAYFDAGRVPPGTTHPVLFVNLACRDGKGPAARRRVTDVIGALAAKPISHLYLKVDSVARGPLAWMLRGVVDVTGTPSVPLLVANPATGRATRRGRIFVNGTLLHRTAFARDPLHAMTQSSLPDILAGQKARLSVALAADAQTSARVIVLDGASPGDVRRAAAAWSRSLAAAGAAPFGVELIRRWVKTRGAPFAVPQPPPFDRVLAVVGTQHPAGDALAAEFRAMGGASVRLGAPPVAAALPLLLQAPRRVADPREVRRALAATACRLVSDLQPAGLMVIGGETAQTLLAALGISTARPVRSVGCFAELAVQGNDKSLPGRLWFKPGSYHDPEASLGALFDRGR